MNDAIAYLDHTDSLNTYKKYDDGSHYFLMIDEEFYAVDNVKTAKEAFNSVQNAYKNKGEKYVCEVHLRW